MAENYHQTTQFDVSAVARLRKLVGHAASSLKFIGFVWLIALILGPPQGIAFPIVLVCGAIIFFCAWQIAELLRSGNVRGATLTAVGWTVWASITFLLARAYFLAASINPRSVIKMIVFTTPLYFLGRGLFAFLAYRLFGKTSAKIGNPLALYPWEASSSALSRQQFLSNKSFLAYWLLLLSAFPVVLVVGVAMNNKSPTPSDSASRAAAYLVTAISYFAAWIAVAHIYRLARRQAMLPASELIKIDVRAIALYLRSFNDDSRIKLRARTTNGRILLERVLKISFEEVVTDHLWRYGPVVAIGNPRVQHRIMPALGAAKDYETDSSWQNKATELVQAASIIVATIGDTPGLVWELDRIGSLGLAWKLVLLLPPLPAEELESRWQFLVSNATSTNLPPSVDIRRTRAVIFPEGTPALIMGDRGNDWTYEAVLDEAALIIANKRNSSKDSPNIHFDYQTSGAESQTSPLANGRGAFPSLAQGNGLSGSTSGSAVTENGPRTRAPGALASVIWGIIGLVTFPYALYWVPLAYARKARSLIKSNPRFYGEKLATAGYVLGIINILVAVIFIYFFLSEAFGGR
jgi:hypothetical protein